MENAIEISYDAIEQNPDKRIFLLSQMIHNQEVNNDLLARGVRFIMDTEGAQFIQWDELQKEDIVIIPAFGTTLEIEAKLQSLGVAVEHYNTTCPFVEKVWNRSEKLADSGYTTIIHGKPRHEETRATFSHSAHGGPTVIVRDMEDAQRLATFVETGDEKEFAKAFAGKHSEGFNPKEHLQRVGVVNQTTMLATETQAIAEFFKDVMLKKYGADTLSYHFADTRDTLCYATNDNQDATYRLLETDADLAIVVGGYNSSNTSHIVELCEEKFPTYFINSDKEILSRDAIRHFDYKSKTLKTTQNFLPDHSPLKIILTSGASCPDTLVDAVLLKLLGFFSEVRSLDEVMAELGV